MTKQEEINQWKNFVAKLTPGTYLRSMFKGSEDTVERMIRNDFAFDPIPELRQRQQELHEENKQLTEKNNALKKRNQDEENRAIRLAQEIERHKHALDAIKEQARRIANG